MPQKKPGKPPIGPGRALGKPKPITGGGQAIGKPGPGYAKPPGGVGKIKKPRPRP